MGPHTLTDDELAEEILREEEAQAEEREAARREREEARLSDWEVRGLPS